MRPVIDLDVVARLALALPETVELDRRGQRTWAVRAKVFAWERPFTQADLRRFGSELVPAGPILATRVADLHDKEAALAAGRAGVFTISHFDGFAAVLLRLEEASEETVLEALADGWLAKAPPAVARAWQETSDTVG